jgi:hypothetical protein
MTDLPLIIHGVWLYCRGDSVMAMTMAAQRRVVLAGHPVDAEVREVSVDSVAEIWVASATPTAVHVNCCITGAAVRRVDAPGVTLLAVTSSALLAFAGGDNAHFVLWVSGMDEQIFGADPSTVSLALSDASLATQAFIGMPSGVVLQMTVLFGQPDWQPAFSVAPAAPTQIVSVPGGAIILGDGGADKAAVYVRHGRRTTAPAPAPLAARITAVPNSDPWVVCADGRAWMLGRPDREVACASRGIYAGRAGLVACEADGLTLWPR